MIVNMSFRHMDTTEALKAFTLEKTEKLQKYFNGKIHVVWNFSVEHQDHIAHCHITGNHIDYFGEAVTGDLYASIELAVDKLERQLKKHKEIVKNRLHRHAAKAPPAA